ncbi:MAG: urea ABC transporter permease subunit UrtB, partial [Rhizobiales bacterium]|nr:urea ABC transporter permease subunit UrtB [Hyphomicrobiales bacterium]
MAAPAALHAQEADLAPFVAAFQAKGFDATERAIGALAATGDPRVVPVLETLAAGNLYVVKADRSVVRAERGGAGYLISDPLTGAERGELGRRAVSKVKVNNNLRRVISAAMGSLTLRAADADVRRDAAEAVFTSQDAGALESLEAALAAEQDSGVRQLMEEARAAILL